MVHGVPGREEVLPPSGGVVQVHLLGVVRLARLQGNIVVLSLLFIAVVVVDVDVDFAVAVAAVIVAAGVVDIAVAVATPVALFPPAHRRNTVKMLGISG